MSINIEALMGLLKQDRQIEGLGQEGCAAGIQRQFVIFTLGKGVGDDDGDIPTSRHRPSDFGFGKIFDQD